MKKGNDAKDWKLGNLITVNQDKYPALGSLFVQIWEGDSVVARVYGESSEEVLSRANDLLGLYGHPAEPVGWQLVPKEPDWDMEMAGIKELIQCTDGELECIDVNSLDGYISEVNEIFSAMLKAAPKFGEE